MFTSKMMALQFLCVEQLLLLVVGVAPLASLSVKTHLS